MTLGFHEDDEDPQDIRAAFDRGPLGVTAFSAHPMIHTSDCGDDLHVGCRADLDAAQDEIERLLSEKESLRERLECIEHRQDADLPGQSDRSAPGWWPVSIADRVAHWLMPAMVKALKSQGWMHTGDAARILREKGA